MDLQFEIPIQFHCTSDVERNQLIYFVTRCSYCFNCKMNLTGLVIATLLSMSDLSVFLDLLIIDGNYKVVSEFYDEEDDAHAYSYTEKKSLMPRLVELSFGKYAMFIIRKIHVDSERDGSNLIPFHRRTGLLQILWQNYGESGQEHFKEMLQASNPDTGNVIVLIPTHPVDGNNRTCQINLYYLEY